MVPARKIVIVAVIMLALWSRVYVCAAADTPRYKHDHLNAYPVRTAAVNGTPLTLDGNLSDWDPRTFVDMYADPGIKEYFSVRAAAAYDASALWLAYRVTDAAPLMNRADPAADPVIASRGDSMQFRLIAESGDAAPSPDTVRNSDNLVQCTAWYDANGRLPVLDIRHGMDLHDPTTLTAGASGFVYSLVPGGYQVEARIPWTVLHVKPPTPGQSWKFNLQPTWGDSTGKLQHSFFDVVGSDGNHYREPDDWGKIVFVEPARVGAVFTAQAVDEQRIFGAAPTAKAKVNIAVKYVNPAKGFVSLAICQPDGQIARTLLAKAPRAAGPQMEPWDGLDDEGKPVPPGNYVVKALSHPGLVPKYVCSVMNSGNPGWGNGGGHYGWGGDEGQPIAAASDPDGNTYLLWTFNEGGDFLIRVDSTGQKQWGARISWGDFAGGATCLVYDNGLIYAAKDGTGAGPTNKGGLFLYDAATGQRKDFPNGVTALTVSEWPSKEHPAPIADSSSVRMHAGEYGIADDAANLVGLAASPDRLFAALFVDNKVVALDKQTCKIVETYPVDRPGGLAYDKAKQLLYAISGNSVVTVDLAHGGKIAPFIPSGLSYPFGIALDAQGNVFVSVRGKQMQVLVFDASGHQIRSIGTPGGRPWIGKFDPNGMLLPSGISIDTKGQLWVAEDDNTPKRVSMWDASTGKFVKDFYGSAFYAPMMAPDPEKPEEVYIHNTRFIVDYDKGTWHPDSTVFRAGYDGDTIPGSEAGYGFMGATFEVQTIDGKKFALNGNGGVFSADSDRFRPLYYLGPNVPGFPPLDTSKNEQPWNTEYRWIDANHDGCIQPDEVVKLKSPYLFGNIAQFGATFYPGGAFIKGGLLFRPTGVSADGIPQYPDPSAATPIMPKKGPMAAYNNWIDVWPVFGSKYSQFYAVTSLGAANGGYGGGGGDCIAKFTPDGKILWRYTRAAVFFGGTAPLSSPGDLFGALRIAGEFSLPAANGGGIVGIGCYRGYFGYLNEDGLFIDQTGYDGGRGPAPSFDTFYIENFSGYLFKHPRTGKVYLFCGDVDGRILEIQGWDKIKRLTPFPITVTEANYRTALTTLPSAVNQSNAAKPLRITAVTPKLDGTMEGWRDDQFASIPLDEQRRARVGLAYDSKNLYARFDVQDSSPWKNSSTDWHFLFKGGDAVDIQLGQVQPTGPGAKRITAVGDVRVMIAPGPIGGIQAVGMWSLVPPGMAKAPLTYKSPVDQVSFERVSLLPDVTGNAFVRTDGYTVVAAIPWSTLGMTAPASGSLLVGDAGVLQSDADGLRTVLRRYLFNQDTGIVYDIPSEVSVVSANWGVLTCD